MINNILTVGTQVIILFILIGVGFVCNKVKMLTPRTLKELTDFVLYIVSPCVIISSYYRDFDKSMLNGLLLTLFLAFLSYVISIALAHLTVKDADKNKESVLRFGAVFSNCGFMSLPLQQAILGADGVFYGATYVAVFNIMLWTYGAFLMSGKKESMCFKNIIINPGVIATIIGIILFVLPIKIPIIIYEPIKYLSALNTPVPMIIIGYHLMQSNILKGFTDLKEIFAMAIKLLFYPLIALGVLYLFGVRGTMLVSSVISCSAPTAAITTMFSAKYGADTSLSVNMVSLSTVLSLATMPVVITLAQHIA